MHASARLSGVVAMAEVKPVHMSGTWVGSRGGPKDSLGGGSGGVVSGNCMMKVNV